MELRGARSGVRAKNVLTRLDVQYDWIDISSDEKARVYVEQINLGNRSVPTIVFPDSSVLVEPYNTEPGKKLANFK